MSPSPPLFLDIDGTLTRAAGGLDGRVIEPLRSWDAPVILATGKAFPYPIALCHYFSLPERVVAENGGIVCVDGHFERLVDTDGLDTFIAEARTRGIDFGWDEADTVNRWRETELAIERSMTTRDELESLAAEHGLEVVDSNYAYHVKSPNVSKGRALERVANHLGIDLSAAVAIGDSENDESMFELAGRSFALANADDTAIAAADVRHDVGYAEGTLEILSELADT